MLTITWASVSQNLFAGRGSCLSVSGCWPIRMVVAGSQGWLWQFLKIKQQWSLLHGRTLPFTWTLRIQCRVINWPNFNTVSQKTGRYEEAGKDRGTTSWLNSQNIQDIYQLRSRPYIGVAGSTHNSNNITSNITDHRSSSQIEIVWKSLKYCKNYQNVTQRLGVNAVGKKWSW